MNGVLSSLTWGTWDSFASTSKPLDNACQPVEHTASRRHRKRVKRGILSSSVQDKRWFEELLARLQHDQVLQGYRCNPLHCIHNPEIKENEQPALQWKDLPVCLHPSGGHLNTTRALNKQLQVENLIIFLQKILRPGDVVVEFCAGSGYVALPLAYLFPQCHFVLLDKKEPSLAIGRERIAAANLINVEIFSGFVDDYTSPFDVGIALHACGEATDMAIQKCLDARASYVMAPCCVGKVKLSDLSYPRSSHLSSLYSRPEFEVLAKAADFGHGVSPDYSADVHRHRRACKTMLEGDRSQRAFEADYRTHLFVMHPAHATPKNDILVGIPNESPRSISLPCDIEWNQEDIVSVLFQSK